MRRIQPEHAMFDQSVQWRELKAKFLRDLTPSEQLFFLKQARESVAQKGYPVSEDLFYYCYSLTLKERLSAIVTGSHSGEGYMRFLLVESRREIEKEVKIYEERLEKKRRPVTDAAAYRLLEQALGDS